MEQEPILLRDSNKGINVRTFRTQMRFLRIIKSPEISWNLLRMFYGMGKRGKVEVDDGPSASVTMGSDWKLRLVLE